MACFKKIHLRCAFLCFFLLALFSASCSQESANKEKTEPTAVDVLVLQPQNIEISEQVSGRATAYLSSDVRPQVGGIILQRLFTEGDEVKVEQPLYHIDPKPYQSIYDNDQALLAQAEAKLSAVLPKARRYQQLKASRAVSEQDTADIVAELKEAQASVAAAKASLHQAKINLDYATIKAPISGRISTSIYTPGALVTANQAEVLTTIQQLDPIYIDFNLAHESLLKLRREIDRGDLEAFEQIPVHITLSDGQVYDQHATLEYSGSHVDVTTGTVHMRALVANPQRLLLPGASVKINVPLARNPRAILVPQNAAQRNNRGAAIVKLVDNQNKVVEKMIDTESAYQNHWVVPEGLSVGTRLIVAGGSQVRTGDQVKIESERKQEILSSQPSASEPSEEPAESASSLIPE